MFRAEVATRLLYGVGLGVVVVTVLANGGPLLLLVVAVAAVLGLREFYRLVRVEGGRTLGLLGYPTAVLLVVIAYLEVDLPMAESVGLMAAWFILLAFVAQLVRAAGNRPLYRVSELSTTFFGVFLTAGFLSYIFRYNALADLFPETEWAAVVLVPVVGAWGYDTAAYFAGRFYGTTRYLTQVSTKTWEGTIGGLVGVTAGMPLYAAMTKMALTPADLGRWAVVGFLCGVVAQIGDLGFSAIKREMRLKDSGKFMPGHGGLLDRLDSFLLVLPIGYYLVNMFFGGAA
ncbi:phosphatidate cytidylyltransferase [bacterium]|nr:phosphatidate cytidylyltransferase [bacterium]